MFKFFSSRQYNIGKTPIGRRNVPRIIIFIIGGITMSEMRCAYEVMSKNSNYDIILGSTHILTPKTFLNDVEMLT